MSRLSLALVLLLALAGCGKNADAPPARTPTAAPPGSNDPQVNMLLASPQAAAITSLAEARRGFQTKLTRKERDGTPVEQPPATVFQLVHYPAQPGKLAAYLTPDPKDGKKHPAIIWITGGDCNTIGEVWEEAEPGNDQSASAYRKAGIVMMFPSLRGGNDNPGVKEGFLGEVDDVLAAADFLGKQPYVDPQRIYLGGHSTGGSLALLTSEYSERFRAVFSFGPVDDVRGYGAELCPFSLADPKEVELRAPGRWLFGIKSPTFVFEGTVQGNIGALRLMALAVKLGAEMDEPAPKNLNPQFFEVRGANHFNLLDPINRLLAAKILHDTEATCNLAFSADEVNKAFGK